MANELAVVPDFIRRLAARTEVLFEDARSNGRAMPPTVSIKGSRFNLISNGDRQPAPNPIQLDFVVVAIKKPMSRAFYAGKFDPKADNYNPPACYSLDGVTPESDATELQSPACRSCKQAEWGSKVDERGNETTACRQHKQLIIKIPGEKGLWLLNVPIASVKKQWDVYAAEIEAAGKVEKQKYGYATLTLATIVSTCTFDDKQPNTLNFKALGYVGNPKFFSPEDCDELEKLLDSQDISTMLWGPLGAAREAQYKDGTAPRVELPAPTPAPKAVEAPKSALVQPSREEHPRHFQTVAPAPVRMVAEDFEPAETAPFDLDYEPPGEPVKAKPAPKPPVERKRAAPQIVTTVSNDAKTSSVLADLGLGDLDI